MNRIAKVAVAAVAALGLTFGAAAVAMYHHSGPPRAVAGSPMHFHG